MSSPRPFPGPDATREEIATFLRDVESDRYLEPSRAELAEYGAHEAPKVENGPSLMCNACGMVRVPLAKPFCNGCMRSMGIAGGAT